MARLWNNWNLLLSDLSASISLLNVANYPATTWHERIITFRPTHKTAANSKRSAALRSVWLGLLHFAAAALVCQFDRQMVSRCTRAWSAESLKSLYWCVCWNKRPSAGRSRQLEMLISSEIWRLAVCKFCVLWGRRNSRISYRWQSCPRWTGTQTLSGYYCIFKSLAGQRRPDRSWFSAFKESICKFFGPGKVAVSRYKLSVFWPWDGGGRATNTQKMSHVKWPSSRQKDKSNWFNDKACYGNGQDNS